MTGILCCLELLNKVIVFNKSNSKRIHSESNLCLYVFCIPSYQKFIDVNDVIKILIPIIELIVSVLYKYNNPGRQKLVDDITKYLCKCILQLFYNKKTSK